MYGMNHVRNLVNFLEECQVKSITKEYLQVTCHTEENIPFGCSFKCLSYVRFSGLCFILVIYC